MVSMTNFKEIQKMEKKASAHTSKRKSLKENFQPCNICRDGKQIENYEGTFANMDCECAVVESMISGLLFI